MEEQLYEEAVAEYSIGATNEEFIPSEHVKGILDTLEGKTELAEVSVDDMYIQQNQDGSYDIRVDEKDLNQELGGEGTINYSPRNERCVNHSNKVIDGVPPEGRSIDGNGNELGGLR